MKIALSNILLLALLFSITAAQADDKKGAQKAPASTAAKAQDFDGWVSDEKCGAKIDAECAKKCEALGVKMVFVNAADKSILPVANQQALKGYAGQHVSLKGKVENGVLTVNSVKPAGK
jgi:Na+-translocating ferredoxin:NAD+ oxidoreductase RnfG subunit